MLREVKNKHIKPRIIPFQVTSSSTAANNVVNIGYGDITFTRASAGALTISPKLGFSRNGLIFGDTISSTGGFIGVTASSIGKSSFAFNASNSADSGTDGAMDGFLFGWDSSDANFAKVQRVASVQNTPRVIWGKVTGATGAVAINARDFSCTRASAGVYNVTFNRAFGKIPVIKVQAISATCAIPSTSSKDAKSVVVTIVDADDVAADIDFYILAIGSDSRSDSFGGRMPLQNSQRLPRIVAGQLLYTSGVPSIVVGSQTGGADFGSLVDVGTGSATIAVTELFKREPAIFLQGSRRLNLSTNVLGAFDILSFGGNGVAADPTSGTPVNIFIIGSDDATQY